MTFAEFWKEIKKPILHIEESQCDTYWFRSDSPQMVARKAYDIGVSSQDEQWRKHIEKWAEKWQVMFLLSPDTKNDEEWQELLEGPE